LAKKPEDHLPKKAPKKTGKKGIGPLLVDEEATKSTASKPELLSDANKKRGKTRRLPGMEDPQIEELEDTAREYVNVRDDRMVLTREESGMKEKLLALMKKHSKRVYHHDGVEIKVVAEEETVKVRVVKDKD